MMDRRSVFCQTHLTLVLIIPFACLLLAPGVDSHEAERRLFKDLFENYSVNERPVAEISDVLSVQIGVTVLQIVNVDVVKGHIETLLWTRLEWNDTNLKWNETEYEGISSVGVSPDKVWMPDVLAYNQVGEHSPIHKTKVLVSSDGGMAYIPPGVFNTMCSISVLLYPFDDHKCNIRFGSWLHDGLQIDVRLQDEAGADVTSFMENPEWKLLGTEAHRVANYFYSAQVHVDFTLHVQRRGEGVWESANRLNLIICSAIILSWMLPPMATLRFIIVICSMGLCTFAGVIFNPFPYKEMTYLSYYFYQLLVLNFLALSHQVTLFTLYYRDGYLPKFLSRFLEKFSQCCKIVKLPPPTSQENIDLNLSSQANLICGNLQDLTSQAPQTQSQSTSNFANDSGNSSTERSAGQHQHANANGTQNGQTEPSWSYKKVAIYFDKALFYIWVGVTLTFYFVTFPSWK